MTHISAGSPLTKNFGDIREGGMENTQPEKFKKLTLRRLRQPREYVPQVSCHDEVDISLIANLMAQRQPSDRGGMVNSFGEQNNPLLPFLVQAIIDTLRAFPQFNAALDETAHNLLIKHYYHIAVAFDMPNGLTAAVIKNADTLTLDQLAQKTAELIAQIKAGNRSMIDTEDASFSLTNLAGTGCTGFSPVIKPPQVAVLGVSQATDKVVARNGELLVRRILPLSLSYDYRVINEAMAAHFMAHLRHRMESRELFLQAFPARRAAC
jgi:pyruvate dehydrogenase E2 component (dihydrolipoamide acetyltransferase)